MSTACRSDASYQLTVECVDEANGRSRDGDVSVAEALCEAGYSPRTTVRAESSSCAQEWTSGRLQRKCTATTAWHTEIIRVWRSVELVYAARPPIARRDGERERLSHCLDDTRIMIQVNCEDNTLPDGRRSAERARCHSAWLDGQPKCAWTTGWQVGSEERFITYTRDSMFPGLIAQCLSGELSR